MPGSTAGKLPYQTEVCSGFNLSTLNVSTSVPCIVSLMKLTIPQAIGNKMALHDSGRTVPRDNSETEACDDSDMAVHSGNGTAVHNNNRMVLHNNGGMACHAIAKHHHATKFRHPWKMSFWMKTHDIQIFLLQYHMHMPLTMTYHIRKFGILRHVLSI